MPDKSGVFRTSGHRGHSGTFKGHVPGTDRDIPPKGGRCPLSRYPMAVRATKDLAEQRALKMAAGSEPSVAPGASTRTRELPAVPVVGVAGKRCRTCKLELAPAGGLRPAQHGQGGRRQDCRECLATGRRQPKIESPSNARSAGSARRARNGRGRTGKPWLDMRPGIQKPPRRRRLPCERPRLADCRSQTTARHSAALTRAV